MNNKTADKQEHTSQGVDKGVDEGVDMIASIRNPNEQINILLVDDEAPILRSLKRLFRGAPYDVQIAESGEQALDILASQQCDVIISDMRMPGMSGQDFLKEVQTHYPYIKRIVLSGYAEPENIFSVVNEAHIYSYVQKPWDEMDLKLKVKNAAEELYLERLIQRQNTELKDQNSQINELNDSLEQKVTARTAELVRANDSLQQAYSDIEQSQVGIIKMLSYYSALTTPALKNHGERVAGWAVKIARAMQLDVKSVKEIESAAFLHDIGMVVISNDIIEKPFSQLLPTEKKLMQKHSILGESTLMNLPEMDGVAKMVRHHHELYDGSGYPDKLAGKNIPLGARIISLANDYDDLINGYCIGHKVSKNDALNIIHKLSSQRYDPDIVKEFDQVINTDDNERKYKEGTIKGLKSSELETGMIICENLVSRDGILLLSTGFEITRKIINGIRRIEQNDHQKYMIYIDTEAQSAGQTDAIK